MKNKGNVREEKQKSMGESEKSVWKSYQRVLTFSQYLVRIGQNDTGIFTVAYTRIVLV